MKVFKLDDEYPTWIVANSAQEALDYYKNQIVGDEDLPINVEDVKELSDEEVAKETCMVESDNFIDEDDNPLFVEKTFESILKENEGSEDTTPWIIASID
jgi:hypothetical protein